MSARLSERSRTVLGARIQSRAGVGGLHCEIRNLSERGAKIMIGQEVGLPSEFQLDIPQRGQSFLCRIRWRRATSAGVEFLAPADGRESSDRDPAAPADITDRLTRLEEENARLWALIEQIQRALPSTLPRPV